eukprot:Phypoly_transcript_00865.p1 GENE.Phypoly_transcript_00865~~Phypoly_transcript_00865.p1  ORF type:complete len:1244 (+),score=186.39 Phypoly_transcript_00865:84-3815(+)
MGSVEQSIVSSSSSVTKDTKFYGGYHMKRVNFVGKNPVPSKYIVIDNETPQTEFLEEFFKDADSSSNSEERDQEHCFLPTKPWVLISVTGGAQDFAMHHSKLEQVFNRGLLRAAQNISAWIVDGGMDTGVMQHVGKAIKDMAVKDVPYIGIATHKMVIDNEKLKERGSDNRPVDYVAEVPNTPTKCALNPNHTHFILVDSKYATWGQEIRFRSAFENYIGEKFKIPIVLIAVNGGPGTLETVAEAVEKKFATVVVQGSGRASDAVAAMVKRAQKANESGRLAEILTALKEKSARDNDSQEAIEITRALMDIDDGVDISAWINFLQEVKGNTEKIKQWTDHMDRILTNYQEVTLFNADDEASSDMDIFILRAILSSAGNKFTLEEKLTWGVVWNRDDIIAEILENEKGSGISSEDKRQAINSAFELSIQLNRPTIFSVLVENGAQREYVNLQKLYLYKSTWRNFTRLPAHAKTIRSGVQEQGSSATLLKKKKHVSNYPPEYSKNSTRNVIFFSKVFSQAGSTFAGYYENFKNKFIANGNILKGTQGTLGSPLLSRNVLGQRVFSDGGGATSSHLKGKTNASYANYSRDIFVEFTVGVHSSSTEDASMQELTSGKLPKENDTNFNESNKTVGFTDLLIWAVFVNRIDLAKVIWRHTTLPVHSALLACQLYRYLSNHCPNKDEYLENAIWFEAEAIKLMNIFEYADIKQVLEWEWSEMGGRTILDIAQDAQCKKFIGHPHIQSWLDDNFYSDKYGKIEPTIATFRIWVSIIMPLLIYTIYKPNSVKKKERLGAQPTNPRTSVEKLQKKSILNFYRLPIVKFWTNTFFYCGFLFVQAWVLCTLDPRDKFYPSEILLWVWVFSLIVEEVIQYIKNRMNHFKYLSNWMDLGIILMHVAYMLLRWVSHWIGQRDQHHPIYLAGINILIIATLFSWGRLLNAFAINDSLGPLYFIIIRLFKDIFLWFFVFAIFAVSFQLGFVNITKQADADPLKIYPDGTFPVSYFTIIGDFSYAAPILQETPLGIALLAIYALLAQVILVNLLIAMMGATYSNVSNNSAEEWQFYRLEVMLENQSASFHPPPTNLIIMPIEFIIRHCKHPAKFFSTMWKGSLEEVPLVRKPAFRKGQESETDKLKMLKKMKHTRDEVIEEEHKAEKASVENIVTNLQERMRTLANERENDRTFLDKKFKDLETMLTKAANYAKAKQGFLQIFSSLLLLSSLSLYVSVHLYPCYLFLFLQKAMHNSNLALI